MVRHQVFDRLYVQLQLCLYNAFLNVRLLDVLCSLGVSFVAAAVGLGYNAVVMLL